MVTELDDATAALWEAVMDDEPDEARELVAEGADPWRPLFGGWSPGRLSLAGPTPDLFTRPAGERGLSEEEFATVREGRRLVAALGSFHYDGTGLACVAGIDAREAVRRLGAEPADAEALDELLQDPYGFDMEASLRVVGVTSVPGGCAVVQPWGYAPQMRGVLVALSAGTRCYGLYANPKSGNQGSIARDGRVERSDLHPGGAPYEDDTPEEVLASYLYRWNAVAYACAHAGLRPTDARAITGPPDLWVELPGALTRRGPAAPR